MYDFSKVISDRPIMECIQQLPKELVQYVAEYLPQYQILKHIIYNDNCRTVIKDLLAKSKRNIIQLEMKTYEEIFISRPLYTTFQRYECFIWFDITVIEESEEYYHIKLNEYFNRIKKINKADVISEKNYDYIRNLKDKIVNYKNEIAKLHSSYRKIEGTENLIK